MKPWQQQRLAADALAVRTGHKVAGHETMERVACYICMQRGSCWRTQRSDQGLAMRACIKVTGHESIQSRNPDCTCVT